MYSGYQNALAVIGATKRREIDNVDKIRTSLPLNGW